MRQSEFFKILSEFARIGRNPDVLDYLESHFCPQEMDRLKDNPIYFYMAADEADQDRIWNAVESRLHRRQLLAAE